MDANIPCMVGPIEAVATKIATDAVKDLLKSLKESLARWGAEVDSTQERIEAALERHQAAKRQKAGPEEISFKDLLRAKATSKVFVPLDSRPPPSPTAAHCRNREAKIGAAVKTAQEQERFSLNHPRPTGSGQDHRHKAPLSRDRRGNRNVPRTEFPVIG